MAHLYFASDLRRQVQSSHVNTTKMKHEKKTQSAIQISMAKWDARFCELAKYVAEWSKDPSAQVGAVVFSKHGGDISIGYNGFPMGVEDSAERLNDKKIKLELVVHAELNAIIAAGSRSQGGTIYVWGKPVCARCAGSIIQAGIKRVVSLRPESVGPKSKWYQTGKIAEQMFKEAGIEFCFFDVKKSPKAASEPPSKK